MDAGRGARGAEKVAALRAVLRSGLLKGLITNEATARCLVEEPSHAEELA